MMADFDCSHALDKNEQIFSSLLLLPGMVFVFNLTSIRASTVTYLAGENKQKITNKLRNWPARMQFAEFPGV